MMKESLKALAVMLKEIDPFTFEQSDVGDKIKIKELRIFQDEDDRRKFDDRWTKLTSDVKKKNPNFDEPSSNLLYKHSAIYVGTLGL